MIFTVLRVDSRRLYSLLLEHKPEAAAGQE
jgi:hypothetical protein